MTPAKLILQDILQAFCKSTENTNKVIKLAGLPGMYNGKRSTTKVHAMILRMISEDKAKQIINQMPFPFIETYHPFERYVKYWLRRLFPERDAWDYFDQILAPMPKIKGYKLECPTKQYSITYK